MKAAIQVDGSSPVIPVTIGSESYLIKLDWQAKLDGTSDELFMAHGDSAAFSQALATHMRTKGGLTQKTSKLLNNFQRTLTGQTPIVCKTIGQAWVGPEMPPTLTTPESSSATWQAVSQLAIQPENFEVQRALSGLDLHSFQKILHSQDIPAQNKNFILAAVCQHLIQAVIDLHRDMAHGDLKLENIFVEYDGDLAADLARAADPDALNKIIAGIRISLIDLDNARRLDNTELSYPDNKCGFMGWKPVGDTPQEKELWILGAMMMSLLTEADYHHGTLMRNATGRAAGYGHDLQMQLDKVNNLPLMNTKLIARLLLMGGIDSREHLVSYLREFQAIDNATADQLAGQSYACTVELNDENMTAISEQLQLLLNAIHEAEEHPAQHSGEDVFVSNGSVITLTELTQRIPLRVLQRLHPSILEQLPVHELPVDIQQTLPLSTHHIALNQARQQFVGTASAAAVVHYCAYTPMGAVAVAALMSSTTKSARNATTRQPKKVPVSSHSMLKPVPPNPSPGVSTTSMISNGSNSTASSGAPKTVLRSSSPTAD